MKDQERGILREKEAVKGRWREYFGLLVNIESKDRAIVTCMGMIGDD